MTNSRRLLWILLVAVLLALGVSLYYASRFHWNSADDAYMFLRYARHWLQGHGPTYNLDTHIEGYTSFAWMALCTGLMGLGVAGPLALKLLAGLSGAAALVLTWLLARRLSDDADPAHPKRSWAPPLAVGLLAVHGSFHFWQLTGAMAVIGAAAVSTAAWLLLYSRKREELGPARLVITGAVFGTAVLFRPETALFAALAALHLLLGPRGRWRRLLLFSLPAALIVGGHLVFRLSYYGEWLPNTFYAKTGFDGRLLSRGLSDLVGFLLVSLPLVVGAACVDWRRRWKRLWPLPVSLLLYWLYLITVGGDWMVYRLQITILPVLAVMASLGWTRVLARINKRALRGIIVAALITIIAVGGLLFAEPRIVFSDRRHYNQHLHNTADYLERYSAADSLIALTSSGAIPFLIDRPILDLVGIADHHIAHDGLSLTGLGMPGHERYDNDYALAREPDWFVLNPYPAEVRLGIRPALIHEADLLRRPEFWREYHFVQPEGSITISLFHRRDDTAGLDLLDPDHWRPWWDFVSPLVERPPELPAPPR